MATGSNSESVNNKRGGGTVEPKVPPFVPKTGYNPRDLRSWAKRTGFVSDYSGEAGTSGSEKFEPFQHRGRGSSSSPKIEIDPVVGRMRDNRGIEIQPASHGGVGLEENVRNENEPVLALNPDGERKVGMRENVNGNGSNGHGVSSVAPVQDEKDEEENVVHDEVKVDLFPEGVEPVDGEWKGPSELKCGLQENPGFG
jgi:nucleobase transporter 1/2